MKIRLLKVKNWLLLSLMGLLGLGGCRSAKQAVEVTTAPDDPQVALEPRPEIAVMYGVPTVDYVAKGKVLDTKGNPVKGAQVILVNSGVDATADTLYGNKQRIQEYIRRSSDTTGADGAFQVTTQDMPGATMRLVVRDIDGKSNGSYENQMITLPTVQQEAQGQAQGWNLGTVTKEVDVRLQSEED